MKTAFYIVTFLFVSFFTFLFSLLIGGIGDGQSVIGYTVSEISLLSGVIVCCTIYIGDQINKLNPNSGIAEKQGEQTKQDAK
jgi:hypothetical protein